MQPWINSVAEDAEYFSDEGCYILELANTASDTEVSIARARVAPGVTTKKHRLVSTTERYVLLNGRGVVHIEGMPDHEVGPGDVVVIPPNVVQSISNIGTEDLVFHCVCSPRFEWDNYQSLE